MCANTNRERWPINKARTKDGYIAALRTFFSDCQSWGWLPRRFDPHRYLVTPRSVKAQMAPQPRVIKDEVWAKLLWAGMNLTEADLTNSKTGRVSGKYPFAMVKAVAVTWLFGGLRADEIRRLRVDCIRWPSTSAEGEPTVCWLEVPVNKSGPAKSCACRSGGRTSDLCLAGGTSCLSYGLGFKNR